MIAEQWGVGQVLWSMLWFFLFFIWIWLLVMVFVDVFRSHDMGGFAKALWVIFIIVLPYLGVFVYLIARGHKMSEHAEQAAQEQDAAMRSYVRSAADSAGSGSRASFRSWPSSKIGASSRKPSSTHRNRSSWPEPYLDGGAAVSNTALR